MKKIIVGQIVNTHGVRGELKVQRTNNEDFNRAINYYIGDSDDVYEVESVRIRNHLAFIKLKGFNNINEVIKFKSKYIYINESDLVALPDDTFYIKDLIGMNVLNHDGKKVGSIVDVLTYAANDVYLVQTQQGNLAIPAVKEFIKRIDLQNKSIYVDLIEGMEI